MLNDGKKHRCRGRPLTRGVGRGSIIHFWDRPDNSKGQGRGLVPPGGEDHQIREWCQDGWMVGLGEVPWQLRGPAQGDPPWSGE